MNDIGTAGAPAGPDTGLCVDGVGRDDSTPHARRSVDTRLAVVADDLTGALDTAVQCARRNIPTLVVAGTTPLSDGECDPYSVVVIDTDSRHVEPDEAARRVQATVASLRRQGANIFYKKIDSTLRGNVGAELAAMIEATRLSELILAPSLPSLGRTVRQGTVYVHGVPLASTDFARDPVHPMTRSYIPDIVAVQSSIRLTRLDSTDGLPRAPSTNHPAAYLFDAETDEDLGRLAHGLVEIGRVRLCAGSAGFLRALVNVLPLRTDSDEPARASGAPGRDLDSTEHRVHAVGQGPAAPWDPRPERTLLVCGSMHPASRRAIARAVAAGYPRIIVPIAGLLSDRQTPPSGADDLGSLALARLQAHGRLILETEQTPWAESLTNAAACRTIAARLGAMAARVVETGSVGTAVVFGGDTSLAVVHALGIDRLVPEGEILPGVAVSRTRACGRVLTLVTKPGGYVHDDVVDAIENWRKLRP